MSDRELLALVDDAETRLEDGYEEIVPECEEVPIARGYFYVSGFDLYEDDLTNLLNPDAREGEIALLGRGRDVA